MNRLVRRLVVAMLLGVAIYAAFALYTGVDALRGSLGEYRWSTFFFALVLVTGNYLLRFLKWQYYLGRLEIRGVWPLDSLLVFLSGFVLTVTPGKLGEVFKSAVLARTHGAPIAQTGPIVVAERLTDVIAVIALILIGSATFEGGLTWAVAGGVAVTAGLTAILWQAPVRSLLSWMEAREGAVGRLAPRLGEAYTSLRILAAPMALLFPTTLSVVGWGAEAMALQAILGGFGEDVSAGRAIFFFSTATLAGALVPIPGGLGIVEGMLREQLVHLSAVAEGAATASMILIRFATLWWAVLVGFAALAVLRVRFPGKLGDLATEPSSSAPSG